MLLTEESEKSERKMRVRFSSHELSVYTVPSRKREETSEHPRRNIHIVKMSPTLPTILLELDTKEIRMRPISIKCL